MPGGSLGARPDPRLRVPGHVAASGRGILFMLLGCAFLTANDATVKWLIDGYPVGEVLFFRGIAVALGVGLAIWRLDGLAGFRVANRFGQALRAATMVAGSFMFVGGLAFLPLADAIAISFAGPLFTAALAVPLLGERVGWRRWLAVLVGFGGVLLMTGPSAQVAQWAVLLPLGACLTGALRDILTRKLTATDATLTTLFYATLAVTLGGLATLPWGWRAPPPSDLALLLGTSALMGLAHYLQIEAFRLAEAAAVAPFRYSSLLWALLFGLLLWGEWPRPTVALGAAVVVGAGLYIWHRERRLAA